MSSKNNVNPANYKVAGRDRQGENIVHEQQKQSLAQEQARLARQKEKGSGPARSGGQGDGGEKE